MAGGRRSEVKEEPPSRRRGTRTELATRRPRPAATAKAFCRGKEWNDEFSGFNHVPLMKLGGQIPADPHLGIDVANA